MTDLKIIDELLCIAKNPDQTWYEFEIEGYFIYQEALDRLQTAWESGEMEMITLGLSRYFEERKIINEKHGTNS